MTFPTWPEAPVALEQRAVRPLFYFLLFHRRFSVDLSHQIVENLQDRNRGVTGAAARSEPGPAGPACGRAACLRSLTSLTLIFDLAEVSKKAQLLHWRARFWPCSFPTTRSFSRSHLFPTRIMGTWGSHTAGALVGGLPLGSDTRSEKRDET